MNRRCACLIVLTACALLVPFRSPAPLIYTPGQGWTYEPVGTEGTWVRTRAKDQLIVAQDAFDKKDYSLALKAARRVVSVWKFSDYAPQAQYLIARCYEQRGYDERAFKEYQKLLEQYPKAVQFEDVLRQQYEIAGRFLAGEWFRAWDVIPIPFFTSMDKTAGLYEKVVKNGPYSDIAPQAQLKIGEARVKEGNYPEAVKAYERAADRYNDRPVVAAEALFQQGLAYQKQAATAEYDQSMAAQAIAVFGDFITSYPNDPRGAEAQKRINDLKTEQARGSFDNAEFYEKHGKLASAKIYYNDVVSLLLSEPNSRYYVQSRERIDSINRRLQSASE
jgi:outer membrane protein assembly factor BamD (BamD/ComL family)